ncbi:hypothetical protein O1611_g1400 [Lasiodiplodia mahajangana]|uniref:Uncharacterized protein n=1 Tax=Lasiodiplodia mahajangana TaxID=1108764 RepID=A0ACC2JY62_9PEZI|nr:hypothetical protein O1611_g1400 [Lasiodiplodia mahajangana]
MAEDLRVKLGKSQIEFQKPDPLVPWTPEVWNAAIAAFHAGDRMPAPRLFVVISSDGPVDSPEKLQKLADLPFIPEVIETNEAYPFSDSIGDTVRVSGISWEEFERLRDRTNSKKILVWMPHRRTKKPGPRNAYIITSVKNAAPGDVHGK